MIYLDNAATTMPSPSTVKMCHRVLAEEYYNPSALYYPAVKIRNEIDGVRKTLASAVKCKDAEIVFTSGATEANNWAIFKGLKNKKGNVIITEGEHPSVYESAAQLKNSGCELRIARLNTDGTVNVDELINLVDQNTSLVSVINVSNETGAINDVAKIAKQVKSKNNKLIFHSDGVQALCKVPIDLSGGIIDLYSMSAHKIGGLKGAGALYIRQGLNIAPLLYGGGQERSLRSGTENAMGILSFKTALEDFNSDGVSDLYDYTVSFLSDIPECIINGGKESASRFIISAGFKGIKSEILQHILHDEGVLIGLGSACSSKTKKNRTLDSMKVEKVYIDGNIRISFSYDTNLDDLKIALNKIKISTERLRSMING